MIVALQQIMRPGFILRGRDGAECADDEQNGEQHYHHDILSRASQHAAGFLDYSDTLYRSRP